MSKMIITIGREFGSGGRTIGKMVAERLGVECYDDKIIDEAAKISGFTTEFIQDIDENSPNSLLYSIVMNTAYGVPFWSKSRDNISLDTQVFFAQREVILKLARNPCVIVGRCADYVLRNEKKLLRCFIYAPLNDRIVRAVNEYGMDEYNAQKLVQHADKGRRNRYNAYTDRIWGARENYDLMINSSLFGTLGACEVIVKAAEEGGFKSKL